MPKNIDFAALNTILQTLAANPLLLVALVCVAALAAVVYVVRLLARK